MMGRMVKYFHAVLMLAVAVGGAGDALPFRSVTADLTVGVLRYDFVAMATLDPQYSGNAIVYETPEVMLPFHPGIAGRLKIRLDVISGGEFGPYIITLNGHPVVKQDGADGHAVRHSLDAVTPALAHRWNWLKISVSPGRKIGLARIEWEPAEWLDLSHGKTWHFTNPAPGRDFVWRMENVAAAELRLNGRIFEKVPAGVNSGVIASSLIPAGTSQFALSTDGKSRFLINKVDGVEFFPGDAPSQPAKQAKVFTIANSRMQISFNDPGTATGARFMAAGITPSIRFGEHELAGTIDGGIAGLADELVEPCGFNEAASGGEFMKFGVGVFRRGSDPAYNAATQYPAVRFFPWQTEPAGGELRFTQVAAWRDIAYRYEKTYRLDPALPVLRVEHRLTNTGRDKILTSYYCHNLFRLGTDRVGAEHTVDFDFDFDSRQVIGDMCAPEKRCFKVLPETCRPTFFRLNGFTTREHNRAMISAGTLAITITGDFVPWRVFLYCVPSAISPEFHRRLELSSGQVAECTTSYEFTEKSIK